MHRVAYVIGNGTSRKNFDLNKLIDRGTIYACNAIYRDFIPNKLIAVDPKMIHEIVNYRIQFETEVWTNYNKAYEKYVGLHYFEPTKGWSSGPTALYKACLDGMQTIYMLGFDYIGLNGGKKVNNIYAGTPNYKGAHEPATYYGNWLRQTETIIREHCDTEFVRVTTTEDYQPNNLNNFKNYKTISYKELIKQFDK